jgi:hypothetical protein
VNVSVRLDDADLKRGIDGLRKKFPFAVKRALKRSATSARAEIAKHITEDTGLPSKRVKDAIVVSLVGDSAIQLEVRGRRLPLIDFRARGPEPSRGRGKGVSYTLPGGRGRDPHAFIATMPSGHRGVFRRAGKARLEIYELRGPSMVRVFEKYLPEGAERGRESLLKNLKAEIAFASKR